MQAKEVMYMKVGEEYEFKHRKSPEHPMIKEKGIILGFGKTEDGIEYVQTNVGSFTKKFVLSILNS
jgi:hypothetical protein